MFEDIPIREINKKVTFKKQGGLYPLFFYGKKFRNRRLALIL